MKTILVADESPSIRQILVNVLRSEGHKLLVASNGRDALKLAFDNDFDAIVADEEMPQLSGIELFKILNADPEKRDIPRIMLSGLTVRDDKPASEIADAFISKNTDLKTELLAALDRLL